MGSLSVWHWLILLAVLVLLFGAKKLPEAARSVGRSLKILKAETKGLRDDDDNDESVSPEMKQIEKSPAPAGDQVADLQRQLDELKQQKNAG